VADPMDALLDSLARVGGLVDDAAPAVAQGLARAIRQQVAAGTDPDGKPWPRTKDGDQALQDAAKNLRVVNVGATVFARLTQHVARHNNGTARGGVQRQILPASGVPAPYARAIKAALDRQFLEAKNG
jgi:hypothetical protein